MHAHECVYIVAFGTIAPTRMNAHIHTNRTHRCECVAYTFASVAHLHIHSSPPNVPTNTPTYTNAHSSAHTLTCNEADDRQTDRSNGVLICAAMLNQNIAPTQARTHTNTGTQPMRMREYKHSTTREAKE